MWPESGSNSRESNGSIALQHGELLVLQPSIKVPRAENDLSFINYPRFENKHSHPRVPLLKAFPATSALNSVPPSDAAAVRQSPPVSRPPSHSTRCAALLSTWRTLRNQPRPASLRRPALPPRPSRRPMLASSRRRTGKRCVISQDRLPQFTSIRCACH
jgi:hypothetical protein